MEQDILFTRLLDILSRYYQEREHGPLVEYLEPSELRQLLRLEDEQGHANWDELFLWVERYLKYAVKTSHPGYVNRMWAGANLPSVIGEIITAATNTSACTFETAPVSTLMEQYLLQTLLDLVGFTNGSGQMTTGSSNANMIAMMAARNSARPAIKQQGLFGQPELFAFVNADAHYSMDRAANILGIGTDHLLKIPVDARGRMQIPALQDALTRVTAAGGLPFFVAATAGTTVRGSYDLIEPLLTLRERYGFWLHVDGAWGGAVVFSDQLRVRYLPCLEHADSFTLDFHKMLGTALMCNVLLFNQRPIILREVCSAGDESYIFHEDERCDILDPGAQSLQCGRRVDSLKCFLDWKFYGRAGLAERVERYLDLCQYAEEQVLQAADLEMVVPRESFNVCFRFRTPAEVSDAAFIKELRDRMHHAGHALVGVAFVNGQAALRLLIANTAVDKTQIDLFLRTVIATGRDLLVGR